MLRSAGATHGCMHHASCIMHFGMHASVCSSAAAGTVCALAGVVLSCQRNFTGFEAHFTCTRMQWLLRL